MTFRALSAALSTVQNVVGGPAALCSQLSESALSQAPREKGWEVSSVSSQPSAGAGPPLPPARLFPVDRPSSEEVTGHVLGLPPEGELWHPAPRLSQSSQVPRLLQGWLLLLLGLPRRLRSPSSAGLATPPGPCCAWAASGLLAGACSCGLAPVALRQLCALRDCIPSVGRQSSAPASPAASAAGLAGQGTWHESSPTDRLPRLPATPPGGPACQAHSPGRRVPCLRAEMGMPMDHLTWHLRAHWCYGAPNQPCMLGACQLSGGNGLGTWSGAAGGFPPVARAWPPCEGCRTGLQQHCWRPHRGSHAPRNGEAWHFRPSVCKVRELLWRQHPGFGS